MSTLVDTDQIKQATVDVANIYDEVEIDDMDFEEDEANGDEHVFRYACPCGDRFRITLEQLWRLRNESTEDREAQAIAICPSCSL